LMHKCMRETLYGLDHFNAYSSETGGELHALRVLSLDSSKYSPRPSMAVRSCGNSVQSERTMTGCTSLRMRRCS
jgi:hypothetical protein